jgi:hypothetical protein
MPFEVRSQCWDYLALQRPTHSDRQNISGNSPSSSSPDRRHRPEVRVDYQREDSKALGLTILQSLLLRADEVIK